MPNFLRGASGQPKLSVAFQRFLRVHVCFATIIQLNSVFMNTFLLRATGDSQAVMYFNIALAAAQPIAMILAVIVVRRCSAIRSQQTGLALFAIIYLTLILFRESAVPYIQIIAVLQSAATGFYYTAYTPQMLSYTADNERDRAAGVMGALSGAISLAIPFASGALASACPDFTGYAILFALGFVTAAGALALSSREAPATAAPQGPTRFRDAARAMRQSKPMRAAMVSTLVTGIYGGTFSFFLNVLLYEIVSSELLIGANTMLGGLAGIVGSAIYARAVRPEMRARAMAISISALLVCALGLFLRLTPATILIFNAFLGLLSPFFANPPTTAYMQALNRTHTLGGMGAEVHALREYFYAAGRVLGVVLILLAPSGANGSVMVVIVLLATQYAAMFLTKAMDARDAA